MTDLIQIGLRPARLIIVEDCIVGIGKVAAYGQFDNPDSLVIFERCIDTVVFHLTGIDPRRCRKPRDTGIRRCLQENTLTAFPKIVCLNSEFAEKRNFSAYIQFVCLFPAYRGICPVTQTQSRIGRVAGSELIATTIRINRFVINETTVSANLIVTHDSVRGFEFYQIEYIAQRSEKFLFGKHPANGPGRKKSETMFGREILGTVVSEITFDKIPIVEIIGNTSGNTLMTIRKCFFGIGFNRTGNVFLRLLVKEQCPYGMFSKGSSIVEHRFEIE